MPLRLAITGPHRVEVIEYQDRPLEAKEVLIRTELATGKHGTLIGMMDDVNFRGQRFDEAMHLFVEAEPGADRPLPSREHPLRTGNCGVGTVIAVGPEVTRWQVGDRVFGMMDVRETNICREDQLFALGDLAPETAVCLEACHVPFHCMRDSHVRFGDTVAVVGLGAIGLVAVKMARLSGADRVYAVDPLANRRDLALRYGADEVFDPHDGDVPLKIHQLLGGRGVDVSIESAGAYAALHTAIRCARVGGTVCSVGVYQGESRGLWLGREWHHNRLTIVVPYCSGWGKFDREYPYWNPERADEAIINHMRRGTLNMPGLLDPIVPLHKGPDVWALIENDPGKVVKYAVRF